MANTLHLLAPGLLGPPPGLTDPAHPPRVPLLETCLTRARRDPCLGTDPVATLCHLLGVPSSPGRDWPSAPIGLLGEGLEPGEDYWLHADPVMLRADLEQVLLFDGRTLGLSPAEAASVAALINRHFQADGWQLVTPHPQRWYLRVPGTPDLVTRPLSQVMGRSLYPCLPQGGEGPRWRGWLNEIQMLMFQSEVNQRRLAAGQPTLGGLWPWGGGRLPRLAPTPWRELEGADTPLTRGLAHLAGIPQVPLEDDWLEGRPGDRLLVWEGLLSPLLDDDNRAWASALETLEARLQGLFKALWRRRLQSLHLYPGTGVRYRLAALDLARFWRRPRPLHRWLEVPGTVSL